MPRKVETETVFVPHEYMAFADRRTDAIVRRCCLDQNIVESVQRSCYLQGLWDGVQLAIAHPELLDELRAHATVPRCPSCGRPL